MTTGAAPRRATDPFHDRLDEAMQRGYVAAWRWLRDRDSARDALQEAAARALAARRSYDPTRPFYPWFYRILRNHCMDRLRTQRRETPLPDDPGATPHATLRAEPRAEHALIAGQAQAAVARGVEALPEALREIIELRHFQDLSYAEIADVLGCPQGTVMSRLYRARKALREHLLRDPQADFLRPDPDDAAGRRTP